MPGRAGVAVGEPELLLWPPGRPEELTLVSVLPELSRALGLGQTELQVVRAAER